MAHRIVSGERAATQIGGYGVCSGRGTAVAGPKEQVSPWYEKSSWVSRPRTMAMPSRSRAAAIRSSMPKRSNSYSKAPRPTPISSRPPVSTSAMPSSPASRSGL